MTPFCECNHLENAHIQGRCRHCPCEEFRCVNTAHTVQLMGLGEEALIKARDIMMTRGKLAMFALWRDIDGRVEELKLPPMTDVHAKKRAFATMRLLVEQWDIPIIAIAGDAWVGKIIPTPGLSQEQIVAIAGRNDGMQLAAALGLLERYEAIDINVQSSYRMLVIQQPYERLGRSVHFLETSIWENDMANFKGRARMYANAG